MSTKRKISLETFLNKFVRISELIAMLSMLFLTAVVCVEVFMRSVLNYPIVASSELYMIFFPWVIFLGAIAVTQKKEHIQITFFIDRLPPLGYKVMNTIIHIVMLIFSVYIIYASWDMIQNVSNQIFPVLRISRSWSVVPMTIAFTLISIILIYYTIKILRSPAKDKAEKEGNL
ncbi:TRAP transporter small permease [Virgibacillus kimchii]